MSFATKFLVPAIGAACLATAAPSQQAGGTISGTLNFEDVVWTLMEQDGIETSYWKDAGDGYALRIVGFPSRRDTEDMKGAFVIEFIASGTPDEVAVIDPRASYFGTEGDTVWSGSGTNVNLNLTAFELSGDDVALAGSLTAAMVPGGAQKQIVEAEDKLVFDGNLQATIGRATSAAD